MKSYFLFCVFFYAHYSFAQDSLVNDLPFFQDRGSAYQNWLEEMELDKILQVREIQVFSEDKNYVSLYLEIPNNYSDRDSIADYVLHAWRELRKAYEERNNFKLEIELFLQMIHLFELDPSEAAIQLYDSYDPTIKELVFFVIYSVDSEIVMDSSLSRSTEHELEVSIPSMKNRGSIEVNLPEGQELAYINLFEKINTFFFEKFNGDNSVNLDEPILDGKRGIYQVSVYPLKEEVLNDHQELAICEWLNRLNFSCSTKPTEWLTFTFSVVDEMTLTCRLDGKFSNQSIFSSKRGTFEPIDYDEESRTILKRYGDIFMNNLKQYLWMD